MNAYTDRQMVSLAPRTGCVFSVPLAQALRALPPCRSVAVAEMIRGKTPEEIRKHFNIKNDFTPEEAG